METFKRKRVDQADLFHVNGSVKRDLLQIEVAFHSPLLASYMFILRHCHTFPPLLLLSVTGERMGIKY